MAKRFGDGYNNSMQKLILVCGPAAIGKSTYCAGYAKSHPDENVFVIAADEVRRELFGTYRQFPPGRDMSIIYEEMIRRAKRLCKETENLTVMLDTTLLYDDRREYFVQELPEFDCFVLTLLKMHDYTQCLIRNKQRTEDKWVPEDVILDMAKHYNDPSEHTKAMFNSVEEVYVD